MMTLRRILGYLVPKRDDAALLAGRTLILLGLSLLVLEILYPLVASIAYDNAGSVLLNRALLSPALGVEGQMDQAARAGQLFGNALAWNPLNGQAYYNLAAAYDIWQDSPSVARALSRATILNPGDVCAHLRFGQVLAAYGQEQRAIQEWRAASATTFFLSRGQTLAFEGDDIGALAYYEQAVAIAPDSAEGYYRLGETLNRLGHKDEALAAFEKATANDSPLSPRRYSVQAEIHIARGEWTAALAAFDQAAKVSSGDPAPYYRQGQVLRDRLEDDETAIIRFQEALEVDPSHAPSRLALGQLYGEREMCDEAARWLAPLLSSEAEKRVSSGVAAQAHALLATCLQAQGRRDVAVSHLEQAATLMPNSSHYLLQLAYGYQEVGRYGDAIGAYRRVLELEPDNVQARQALEELGQVEP